MKTKTLNRSQLSVFIYGKTSGVKDLRLDIRTEDVRFKADGHVHEIRFGRLMNRDIITENNEFYVIADVQVHISTYFGEGRIATTEAVALVKTRLRTSEVAVSTLRYPYIAVGNQFSEEAADVLREKKRAIDRENHDIFKSVLEDSLTFSFCNYQ